MAYFADATPKFDKMPAHRDPFSPDNEVMFAQSATLRAPTDFVTGAAMTVPALIAGMVDTFGTSLGFLDDNEVQSFLNHNSIVKSLAPGIGDFYEQNNDIIKFGADVIGAFIPGALALKAVRGGLFARTLIERTLGTNASRFLLSTGKSNKQLFEEAVSRAEVLATKRQSMLHEDVIFRTAKLAGFKRKAADFALEALATESAIAATMHSSDVLFPVDYTVVDNLVLIGGVNMVLGGASLAIARHVVNTNVRKTVGKIFAAAENPSRLPISGAFHAVDNRGPAISTLSFGLRDVITDFSDAVRASDDILKQNSLRDQAGFQTRLRELFIQGARDNPIPGVTSSVSFREASGEIETLQAAAITDPSFAGGLRAFQLFDETAGRGTENAITRITTQKERALKQAIRKFKEIENKPQKMFKRRKQKLSSDISRLRDELDDLRGTTPIVVELDGTTTAVSDRIDLFQDGVRSLRKLPDGTTVAPVGRVEITVDPDGVLRLPAEVDPSLLPREIIDRVTPTLDEVDGAQLLKGLNMSEQELRNELRSFTAGALLPTTAGVRALRAKFPGRTVIAYAKNLDDSEFALTPTGAYTKPVVVGRDEIFGLTKDKKILARKPSAQKATPLSYVSLTPLEASAALDATQSFIERINPDTFKGIEISETSHFTQLDAALEIYNKFDKTTGQPVAGKKIRGWTSPEAVEYASLRDKFYAYQVLRNAANKAGAEGRPHWGQNVRNVAKILNLPVDGVGLHPIVQMFESSRVLDSIIPLDSLAKNLDEVREVLRINSGGTPADEFNAALRFRGNMLNLPRSRKPVLMLTRNLEPTTGPTREQLLRDFGHIRTEIFDKLSASSEVSPHIAAGLRILHQLPETVEMARVELPRVIQDTEHLGGTFTTQAFATRDIPAFGLYDSLADESFKANGKATEQLLAKPNKFALDKKQTIQQSFNKILSRGAEGDLLSYNIAVNARQKGWDVSSIKPIKRVNPDGTKQTAWQFVLRNNARNRQIWHNTFHEAMPNADVVYMPVTGTKEKPVSLTQTAYEAFMAQDTMWQEQLTAHNAIMYALGMPQQTRRKFHVPAKVFRNKHVVFLLDNSGKVRSAVGAPTKAQAIRLAEKERGVAKEALTIVDQTTVQRYAKAKGQAIYEMDDFSLARKQTGASKGTQVGEVVETGSDIFQAQLEQLLRGFNDIAREMQKTVFQPDLQYLKLRHEASGAGPTTDTVYSLLQSRILGLSRINQNSIVGRIYNRAEDAYDTLMQRLNDSVTSGAPRLGSKGAYTDYTDKMIPEFNPFNDFADYLEKTAQVRLPGELRKHAGRLNAFTTALTIRMFDIGMMVINVVSLGSTLPVVVKGLQPLDGESAIEHLVRINAVGSSTPKGLGFLNPGKAMATAMHDFFTAEGQAAIERARNLGYFDQFAAELAQIYGKTGDSFTTGILRSIADKTSILTDKSERFARGVSWFTFYTIGKRGLGLRDEAAMAFAHVHANNTIADFRPTNRPTVFQGAVGMPLGLFTTFMWNYLQRMYRLAEIGDRAALSYQVGLQTMLFGAESVPGIQPFIETFTTNYDGTANVTDRLNDALGMEATDVFLNGSLSSVPKLFGADTGISVAPRAAIGLPGQSGFGAQSVAGFRYATRVWQTMLRAVDSIREREGIDLGRMGEIVAASNLNKGLSNLLESPLALGHAIDLNDNVIEQDTATRLGTASRLLGFKPLYADELRQQNRRNRVAERIQGQLKERLANELRSMSRRGKLTGDNVELALSHYVRAGGSPENFKRFFMQNVTKGLTSKLDLEIAKAIKESHDQHKIARLLFLSAD